MLVLENGLLLHTLNLFHLHNNLLDLLAEDFSLLEHVLNIRVLEKCGLLLNLHSKHFALLQKLHHIGEACVVDGGDVTQHLLLLLLLDEH